MKNKYFYRYYTVMTITDYDTLQKWLLDAAPHLKFMTASI